MRSSAYRPDRRRFMHTATSILACLIGSVRGLRRSAMDRDPEIDRWIRRRQEDGGRQRGDRLWRRAGQLSRRWLHRPRFTEAIRRDIASAAYHSMTKAVTGIATMLLVDDGKLSLDRPVADVLPEWRALRVARDRNKDLASQPATKSMTFRHLLAHTSGLGDWAPSAGSDPLSVAYRERSITPGNRGIRLKRPGYGPQAVDLKDMVQRIAEVAAGRRAGHGLSLLVGGLRSVGTGDRTGQRQRIRHVLPRTDFWSSADDVDGLPRGPRAS